jgi:hypothetical protein
MRVTLWWAIEQFQQLWQAKRLPEIEKPQPIKKEASLFD